MATTIYPSSSSSGIGALVYSFAAVIGAEYDTNQLNSNAIYEFRSPEAPVTVAIYAVGALTNPAQVIRINEKDTFTYSGTVGRIRVLNSVNAQSSILISTYSAANVPTRTGSAIDGIGEQYVHTEKSTDWFAYEGYGYNTNRYPMTRVSANDTAWVTWTYNSSGTGVYRVRNSPNGVAAFAGLTGNFFYKDLNNTTNTWTKLADIPAYVQANADGTTYVSNQLRRGVLFDDGDIIYGFFKTATQYTQTIASTVQSAVDTYLVAYTKATDTWSFIGAYSLGTVGVNSYVDGPTMFFTSTVAGTKYLYNWQYERSGNGMLRYNLSTGARTVTALAASTWNEGAFVNGYFLTSPTAGIGNIDTSATDYQIYDPVSNQWAVVSAPSSRVNEGATWQRGGQVFRYNATSFGVIGRRTYTTNATAPSNIDHYWGRRLWIYDTTSANLDRWSDIAATMGDFYPISMRPGNDTYGSTFIYQPKDTNWNGRFFRFRNNFGGNGLGRYNHDYLDVTKTKSVTWVGDYRPRGEMSVGANSVLAFGFARNAQSQPVVYLNYGEQTPDSEVQGGQNNSHNVTAHATQSFETWGAEIIYTDGRVYPVVPDLGIVNAIYDPQMRRYYVTGWKPSRTEGTLTANTFNSGSHWRKMSAIIEEDTGTFQYMDFNYNDNTAQMGDPGELVCYSGGRAYKPGVHWVKPYDENLYMVTNLWNSYGQDYPRNYRLVDYTWRGINYQGGGYNPQRYTHTHDALNAAYMQVVKFGTGDRSRLGIPDGTIYWDGRSLLQYSSDLGAAPFTETQTLWRRLHTTTGPYVTGDSTMYKTPSVWFDGRYAVCQRPDNAGYYVFDMDNLASEPKVISAHIPINARPTPQYLPASSGTVGNNWSNFYYNSACLGGVEIIAGGVEQDGTRSWRNTSYFIVRQKEV
jgi:hypothetical protein